MKDVSWDCLTAHRWGLRGAKTNRRYEAGGERFVEKKKIARKYIITRESTHSALDLPSVMMKAKD